MGVSLTTIPKIPRLRKEAKPLKNLAGHLTVGDATPTVTSENTPSGVNTLGRCSVRFTLHFKE